MAMVITFLWHFVVQLDKNVASNIFYSLSFSYSNLEGKRGIDSILLLIMSA